MKKITTIDLWTEQYPNHYECFNGAFVDGFENGNIPFDEYKVVKNCNCLIQVQPKNFDITNKHQSIIFYKDKEPVRLVVLNGETDVEKCIEVAVNQYFHGTLLKDLFDQLQVKSSTINKREKPIYNDCDASKEVDTGSCDRWPLLYSMLKGSYTESDTSYGNFENSMYEFIPEVFIKYELKTDKEYFEIEHYCAFVNTIKTRIIPIQASSSLGMVNHE